MESPDFWNDMNEPAVFDGPGKTMPDNVQHRIDEPGFRKRTATHLEIHNIFGMQNARATNEGELALRPERTAICDDASQLRRRPALQHHLDRRQQLHLESPAHDRAPAGQPGPERLFACRRRRGWVCRFTAARFADQVDRDCRPSSRSTGITLRREPACTRCGWMDRSRRASGDAISKSATG